MSLSINKIIAIGAELQLKEETVVMVALLFKELVIQAEKEWVETEVMVALSILKLQTDYPHCMSFERRIIMEIMGREVLVRAKMVQEAKIFI